jgi:2-polyprenyl-6-methoxyphenol hydroxylase-like FAD-dependent oxidoreductase
VRPSRPDVAIVGAGPGGAALAVNLAALHRLDVLVLEREAAPQSASAKRFPAQPDRYYAISGCCRAFARAAIRAASGARRFGAAANWFGQIRLPTRRGRVGASTDATSKPGSSPKRSGAVQPSSGPAG